MMRSESPRVLIIAGPNGAGKTTFASEFLPNEAHCPTFINADLIAAGLEPFNPEKAALSAGRIMLQRITQMVAKKQSFAFETTLSGLSYAKSIPLWRRQGFVVELIFLSLPNADLAVERVKQRVLQGGHAIDELTIRRRFTKGIRNLREVYTPIVDAWFLYDNSEAIPLLLSKGGLNETSPTRY